jgi:hypothetical protein
MAWPLLIAWFVLWAVAGLAWLADVSEQLLRKTTYRTGISDSCMASISNTAGHRQHPRPNSKLEANGPASMPGQSQESGMSLSKEVSQPPLVGIWAEPIEDP